MPKPTKAQLAQERIEKENAALTARHCHGCPYRGCVGATAMLDWKAQTARYRDEEAAVG